MIARLPLTLSPQTEGGFTVTSALLPELVTEGDTFESALENAKDALIAVVELYEDAGRELPSELFIEVGDSPFTLDAVLAMP